MLGESVRDYSELQEEGAAILPTELWAEVNQLNSAMTGILVAYDEGQGISPESMFDFVARSAKVALISRAVLGIDELTTESLKLYSSEENLKRVAELELKNLRALHYKRNA